MPDVAYGFSGTVTGTNTGPDVWTGSDVVFSTGTSTIFSFVWPPGGNLNPPNWPGNKVAWSLKMHSYGNIAGAGNFLLGDGSGQQASSASIQQNWLKNAADQGNFNPEQQADGWAPAFPPNVRLCFP